MKKEILLKCLPILLAVLLYALIYWVRLQQGGWDPQIDIFKGFRDSLDKQISSYLPSPQAELLSGILLGENKNLPGQFKLALRDTSTLHIVVASGENLTLVAGFFFFLPGLLKRRWALALTFTAIIFYTILTGMQVPIIRAAIMVSLSFLAQVMGRERDGPRVLLITAGLMLLINPAWISSISFQLSILATAGVVLVSPIILERLKFLPLVADDLAVSLAAQLMVMPVIAQDFHQVSLVALPTNMMVLWTVPIIMLGGAILLPISFVTPILAVPLAIFINSLLTYFIYVVNFFAGMSWSWVYIGELSWLVWVGYYLIVASILLSIKRVEKPAQV